MEYFLNKLFKKKKSRCIDQIITHIKNKKNNTEFLSTLNTNTLYILKKDLAFKKALTASKWVIPDGVGALISCRIFGLKIYEKISGADIFKELSYQLNKKKKYRYIFFGSTNATLKLIKKKLNLDYPNIKIAGYLSPPFKNEYNKLETDKMINYINKKKANVLWVGLTQPKQEKWIYENLHKLDVNFIGAIGAVFDFYSGNIKRAPKFIQNLGFEWLYRITQDPKRLWKRYLFSGLNFIFIIIPYLFYKKIIYLLKFNK